MVYDRADPDTAAHTVELDEEEADHLAELLHSRPLADRLAAVEQRLAELTGRAPGQAPGQARQPAKNLTRTPPAARADP
ncbi:hypothetical protein [Nonomuraea guangzhouensis]|uniref:Potassium/proton antiporter subunit KhtT-like N-terminal domain-containing protein n=1 Tax=Nonomuraea guangzhouensis TaxID=1291555 RepID=A0ABW4GUD7_9ACTN|nr:hypothetical protein [Nonomuraea guangzhouensis]